MILRAVLLTTFVFFLVSPILGVHGAEWYVDDSVEESGGGATWETAFKTIQEGINAATDGDTVIVAEGTYTENINFNDKNLILRSTEPTDPAVVEKTIIDGG